MEDIYGKARKDGVGRSHREKTFFKKMCLCDKYVKTWKKHENERNVNSYLGPSVRDRQVSIVGVRKHVDVSRSKTCLKFLPP